MQGPELGVQADDMENPEVESELKQEVLENKDVRFLFCFDIQTRLNVTQLPSFHSVH